MSETEGINQPQRVSGLAIASLALCIFLPIFGCIPGIICGHIARSKIRNNAVLTGDGFATAGLIVGYAILILFLGILVGTPLIAYLVVKASG